MIRMKQYLLTAVLLCMVFLFAACGEKEADTPLPEAEAPVVATSGITTPDPNWPPEGVKTELTLSMIGDCTLSSSQYNNDYEKVLDGDCTWPFSGTIQYLGQDDFTLANLECAFSDEPMTGAYTFYFYGPTSHAEILTEGSVECVTMGNNHTEDFGQKGIDRTHDALDAVGMPYIDADDCRIFEVEGMHLGVYVAPYMPTVEDVQSGVAALQERGADIIVVCAHWGNEGTYHPTTEQQEVGHAAIDAGADIVYGTHPHVLQPMEQYGDGYILYSMGNFSFGGNTAPRDRDAAIAQAHITLSRDGLYSVESLEFIPCCLSSAEKVNDYRPQPYEEGSEEYVRTMSKLNGTFDGPDLTINYSSLTG